MAATEVIELVSDCSTTRIFQVQTEFETDGPECAARANVGGLAIPEIADAHPDDRTFLVRSIASRPDGPTFCRFLVTVKYSGKSHEGPAEGDSDVAETE